MTFDLILERVEIGLYGVRVAGEIVVGHLLGLTPRKRDTLALLLAQVQDTLDDDELP